MLKLHLTFYDNCKDTKPKSNKLSFDEFVETFLRCHDLRPEKDGPMYSGAILTQYGTRSNKATKAVSMGILDFDNADPEQVKQALVDSGFRAVIVTTHSHTPATPCFRVVIPFKAPVPASLWPQTFAAFNDMFDGAIDPQTKSVSQAFYLPSCPQENSADAFVWTIEGEVFDAIDTLAALGHNGKENDEEETLSRTPTAPTGSSSKECPRKLAEEILRTMFGGQLKYFNYEFYAYADGYWKPQSRKVDIEKRILDTFRKLNIGIVKQIVENLESLTIVENIASVQNNGDRLLCLNNTTLNLKTGKMLVHNPDHNLINKMDVDWNPAATAPTFLKALNDIFLYDDDREVRVQLVLEWFGYCLIPDISQHKFLWLVGSGGNGKSLILNTLAALIGKDNVSYAMLERMGKPSVRAELQGKLCNISHEMSADATIADGYLKAIVAGDWVEAERKFQPSFSYQPFVRIVAATNSLPYLKDTTDGFFRRAIILELTRKFAESEMDKHLQEKILTELDGILVLAVQALMRLLKRDEFIIPESAIRTANRYRDESDSVRYFIREACTGDGKGTKPAELYEQYQRFAARFRFPALNLIKFGKQLNNLGIGSRDSNGSKFWLVTAKDYQREVYTRTTLENAME
jgi:P4 family phage/plasmid primase-like protien